MGFFKRKTQDEKDIIALTKQIKRLQRVIDHARLHFAECETSIKRLNPKIVEGYGKAYKSIVTVNNQLQELKSKE